jgi:hypothetical protein
VGGKLYVPEFQPDRAGGYVDFRNDLNITPDGRETLKGSGRIQTDPEIVENNALSEQDRLQQTANANLGYRRQFDKNNAVLNVDASQEYNLTQNLIKRDLPNVTFSASGPLVPVSEDAPASGGEEPWYRSWNWNYGNRFNVNQIIRPTVGNVRGDSTVYMGYSDNISLTGKYTALNYVNFTPTITASQLWSAGERTGDTADPYRNAFRPGEERSSPRATASCASTPSGPRNRTKAPSRTPSPEIPSGSTWAMATAGKKARRAVMPAGWSPRERAAATAASTRASWYAKPTNKTLAAARGCWRRRSSPRCTAAAKRLQPSLVSKRPPIR